MASDEEYNKLKEELQEYKRGKDDNNERILSILTAGKALSKKNINYYITDDVSIEVLPYIPREVRDWFVDSMDDIKEEGPKALSIVEDIYAEFMAKMCVDESLKDPSVWKEFNDVSGKLASLGSFIFRDLTISEKDMTSFRRK